MKAYVIKGADGKYFSIASHNYKMYWGITLLYCHHFMRFEDADSFLKDQQDIEKDSVYKVFKDCKVVAIEIKEIGAI